MLIDDAPHSFSWDLDVFKIYVSDNRDQPSNLADADADYKSAITKTMPPKIPVIICNDYNAKEIHHFAAKYKAIFVDKYRNAIIYRENWYYIAGKGQEPWEGNAAHLAKVLLGMEQLLPETTRPRWPDHQVVTTS